MSPPGRAERREILSGILARVSRSFYLSLRILPRAVREPMGIAYLLARTSDTIADTGQVESRVRLEALEAFARWIDRPEGRPPDLRTFLAPRPDSAERFLLERVDRTLFLLTALAPGERDLVRRVLGTIISGQVLDLERFSDAAEQEPVFLETEADLEDYTFRVAGCVGEFWTRLCFLRLQRGGGEPAPGLVQQGIRFGQGLQMVNILRDAAEDRRQGRCYLPRETLSRFGILPGDWSPASPGERLAPLLDHYRRHAADLLRTGWGYIDRLPRTWLRVHLSCSWPILIGLETLEALPVDDPLNPARRARIPRRQVRSILARTLACWPLPPLWRRLPNMLEKRGRR